MAALQTLNPTPLVGKDFLKSTHMQLGLDFRQWGDTMKSTFKSYFLPATANKLRLSQQPKPAQVEHKDLLQTKEFQSETCNAFSLKQLDPIERVPAWSRLTTNFRMHGDPRSDTFITIHSSHFKPRLAGHIPSRTTVAYQKGGGYVGPVCGDREEFTLPLTEQSAYEGHDVRLHPTVRAPCKHLGDDAAIRGEKGRGTSYHTHNRAVFEGRRHPPPQPVEKPDMKECRPPVDGSQLITQSNVEIGKPKLNPCFYSTSTASHYWPATVPVTRARTQVSMVQLGGHDRKEWQTTMQSDYQVPVQDKQRLCASHLQQTKSHTSAADTSAGAPEGRKHPRGRRLFDAAKWS
ncbi:UNVERIFIED_CONTAM: hypothetical protein FKN15_023769 [Acipenser sinensis]